MESSRNYEHNHVPIENLTDLSSNPVLLLPLPGKATIFTHISGEQEARSYLSVSPYPCIWSDTNRLTASSKSSHPPPPTLSLSCSVPVTNTPRRNHYTPSASAPSILSQTVLKNTNLVSSCLFKTLLPLGRLVSSVSWAPAFSSGQDPGVQGSST